VTAADMVTTLRFFKSHSKQTYCSYLNG